MDEGVDRRTQYTCRVLILAATNNTMRSQPTLGPANRRDAGSAIQRRTIRCDHSPHLVLRIEGCGLCHSATNITMWQPFVPQKRRSKNLCLTQTVGTPLVGSSPCRPATPAKILMASHRRQSSAST